MPKPKKNGRSAKNKTRRPGAALPAGTKKVPKGGRSPWAVKPRTVSKRAFLAPVRAKFAKIPISKALKAAIIFRDTGIAKVSEQQKADFIRHNRAAALRALDAKAAVKANFIDGKLSTLGVKDINKWVGAIVQNIFSREGKKIRGLVSANFKKYLNARQIPVKTIADKRALEEAVEWAMRQPVMEPINLAFVEQAYLKTRRRFRGREQVSARYKNMMFRKIFSGERLTKAERKRAIGWMGRNFPSFVRQQAELQDTTITKKGGKLVGGDLAPVREQMIANENAFIQKGLDEVVNPIRAKAEAVAKSKKPAAEKSVARRAITREQRKDSYQPKEPPKKRNQGGKPAVQRKVRTKKVDSVALELRRLGKENGGTAKFMKTLLRKGHLEHETAGKLLSHGTLTQKVFQIAATDPVFTKHFRGEDINRLGIILSTVGSEGRRINVLRHMFSSPEYKKLFEFLIKQKFLDTRHVGGLVAYLPRATELAKRPGQR